MAKPYQPGDVVHCFARFAVPSSIATAGGPVDPDTVTFIARDPHGNLQASTTASVVNVAAATGAFMSALEIPLAATSVGNWTFGFRATGGYQGATPDTLIVVERSALDG